MKKAFSLVELVIVVAVLGILAAIVLPTFQGYVTTAKEAAAKDNLRILRSAIKLYTAQHSGVPPGYPNGDMQNPVSAWCVVAQLTEQTNAQGQLASSGAAGCDRGPYIRDIPLNSFNENSQIQILQNNAAFPDQATGLYGWIYQPETKTIKLDWPGTDKDGIRYYDY